MGFKGGGGYGGLREQSGADSAKYCSNFEEMRKKNLSFKVKKQVVKMLTLAGGKNKEK